MPPLQMSFACGLYDRMNALYTGEVTPEGIDLNFLAIHHPRDVFDRMIGGREFDASELSASEYICRYAAGDRQFIALPVFPSRAFRHGFIAVNDRTVKQARDLNGKKVGVQLYTMTAAVWIRGLLLQQPCVDLASIEWVEGAVERPGAHGKPTVLPPLKPVTITQNMDPRRSISDLLADGEIDATIGADLPTSFGKAEHVKRLFPDFKAVEKKYYKEHGIFPIMHLVVLRRELYERYPFIASSLYEAFDTSKNLALARMKSLSALRYMMPWLPEALDDIEEVFGDDPWPYGVEANRKTLEALVQNLVDQSMIDKTVSVDELFAVCRPNQFPVG